MLGEMLGEMLDRLTRALKQKICRPKHIECMLAQFTSKLKYIDTYHSECRTSLDHMGLVLCFLRFSLFRPILEPSFSQTFESLINRVISIGARLSHFQL